MEEKFCKFCGAKIPADAVVCSSCGRQVKSNAPFGMRGQKNKYTSFLLCLFFGGLGIHRFYEGKIGTGFLSLSLRLWAIGLIIGGFASYYSMLSTPIVYNSPEDEVLASIIFSDVIDETVKKDVLHRSLPLFIVATVVCLITIIWQLIDLVLIVTKVNPYSTVDKDYQFETGEGKKRYISFLLCLVTGLFGLHRFYEGKIGEGIVCIICTILFAVIIPSWSRWWAGYFPCLIVGWFIRANGIVAELALYVCKPKLCVAAE